MDILTKKSVQEALNNLVSSGVVSIDFDEDQSLLFDAILDKLCSEEFQPKRIGMSKLTLIAALSIMRDQGADVEVADPYFALYDAFNFHCNISKNKDSYIVDIQEV